MRLDLSKKHEGTWASFNESCSPALGDGTNKDFRVPIPTAEIRALLVLRGFEMMATDGRLVVTNEKDGTILKDEPDGYKTEVRDGDTWIIFDKAPAFGVPVRVSSLGRKVDDAFKVIPLTTVLQRKIREKQPAIFRGTMKDLQKMTQQDAQEGARVSFEYLLVDWISVDTGDSPPPCTSENKKAFLDQNEAAFFGAFVMNRALAVRNERINSHEKDSSD